jgi:hypothetical protein
MATQMTTERSPQYVTVEIPKPVKKPSLFASVELLKSTARPHYVEVEVVTEAVKRPPLFASVKLIKSTAPARATERMLLQRIRKGVTQTKTEKA